METAILWLGPFGFGLVIGWVTYRTLRRRKDSAALSDIATVLGAVGGGAVTALWTTAVTFSWYCFGLAVGFFLYFIIGILIDGVTNAGGWMMASDD